MKLKDKTQQKTKSLALRISPAQQAYLEENSVSLEEIRELLFNPVYIEIVRNK